MENREVLVEDEGTPQFLIEYNKDQTYESVIYFTVYEVISWNMDETVHDTEEYLQACIKWDGCSHINFSEDGYKHLCGRFFFDQHIKVMNAIWEVAKKKVKGWDAEVAS